MEPEGGGMKNIEAARKLYNILHDDSFSWTPESVEAFHVAIEALKASCSETPNSKWVRVSADRYTRSSDYIYKCSKCGEHTVGMPRYCPNCGAKMEVHNGGH